MQFLTFDVVADLTWGWLPTINTQHVFASRNEFRDIPIASPGAESAMRLIKVLVRRQPITDDATHRIIEGASVDPKDFGKAFTGILGETLVEDLLASLNHKEISKLHHFCSRVRRSIFWHAYMRHPVIHILGMTRYFLSRIGRYWRGSLGACITMIGPDGAGKTALASRLAGGIGSLTFKGSKVYHTQFNMLPRLSTIFNRVAGTEIKQPDFTRRHSGSQVKPAGLLKVLLYLIYYIWDYQLGRFALVRRKGRSQLILFDRYFYNYYYQKAYVNVPWLLLDFFRALVPKPDLVLILQADAQAIYARKPELDCPEIERQLNAIEKLSHRLGRVASIKVQTDRGLEFAEDTAVRAIFASVAARNKRGRTFASTCTLVRREVTKT